MRRLEVRHATATASRVGGLAIPFDEWTKVDDGDGPFLERFRPGSFTRTLRSDKRPKLLFQHGRDFQVGQKVLGSFERLVETAQGLEFEGQLLNTTYAADIAEGVRLGEYGVSIAFRVWAHRVDRSPGRSSYNPDGLPERSVLDAELYEVSIVTWPAYKGTKVGLRARHPSWWLPQSSTERMDYLLVRMGPRPGHEPWRLSPPRWKLSGTEKKKARWKL